MTAGSDSIVNMRITPATDGAVYFVTRYYNFGTPDLGMFAVFDANMPKSAHNGIDIHSPTVPNTGLPGADKTAYRARTGETSPGGNGC